MTNSKNSFIGYIIGGLLSLCGCSQELPTPSDAGEPTLVEEVSVSGFDSDSEPVIKKWSDGTLSIVFEAMPPFFAEEDGTESDFESFDVVIQDVLGVSVSRQDREVFVIDNPDPDTAAKAKAWLETFHDQRS
ncbi:MAG: hypothetical protein HKN47_23450 [Pirellulaceae bacterium]|nr:hypothetical protein [Pirellulaceae bacterium]